MSRLSTVTEKYQISIPVEIARSFEIAPKDKVLVEREEGWIKISPLKEKSFLDLYGVIKKKKVDFKKIRRKFEKEMGKRAAKIL